MAEPRTNIRGLVEIETQSKYIKKSEDTDKPES